jgi:hypothetical protein
MKQVHARLKSALRIEYHLAASPDANDEQLAGLAAASVVVNATGLGKDRPGSPLTDAAVFPDGAVAWDFNYRGDLVFLQQAERQAGERNLRVEDGWTYFIHGVEVTTAPGANAQGVAELTIALMLAGLRHIPWSDAQLKVGAWQRREGIEVAGRVLGIVGCGQIGRRSPGWAWAWAWACPCALSTSTPTRVSPLTATSSPGGRSDRARRARIAG